MSLAPRHNVVLALLVAASPPPLSGAGCSRPRARLTVSRFEGARPELALLRCQASGLRPPIKYAWKLGAALRPYGWGNPVDEETLLVQVSEPPAGMTIDCSASDGTLTASASADLAPVTVTAVSAPQPSPGAPLTVEGTGFGPAPGPDDALYLVPRGGAAVRVDHECKDASWVDTRIVACLPHDLERRMYQVRVQSAGRLGIGPVVTVGPR
jgi:hypothetical protein